MGVHHDLVTAVLEAEDWERNPGEQPDCCDVVLIAQVLSYVGSPRLLQVPPLPSLPAFQKLALKGMTPEESLAIIDQAGDSIAELHRSLQG